MLSQDQGSEGQTVQVRILRFRVYPGKRSSRAQLCGSADRMPSLSG